MFLSIDQIEKSLSNLESIHPFYGVTFLVCKKNNLPVGSSIRFPISDYETELLDEHYKPNEKSNFFYRVFRISDKGKKWLSRKKYASSTLQSTRTQSEFRKAFVHEKQSDEWGWQPNYIEILRENLLRNSPPFKGKPVPAFDLAVWLYYNQQWDSNIRAEDIIEKFFIEFSINESERKEIFDDSIPENFFQGPIFQEQRVVWQDLRGIIGDPPDDKIEEGAALSFLELKEIGPATKFCYEPADRLNIITGDNSLGKTFLLETIWWALTGEWLKYPALPRRVDAFSAEVAKTKPKISFSISTADGRLQSSAASYNWDKQRWVMAKREVLPGLVIYARFDGSFAVWDSARYSLSDQDKKLENSPSHLFFEREDIWNGKSVKDNYQGEKWLCNGLIRDWVTWQTGGARHEQTYKLLVACLKTLSPSDTEPLRPGDPTRISVEDSRDFPTLQMPYSIVPVVHAAAGVQRILAIAYIMVWAWHEHIKISSLVRRDPQRRLVLIIDEVEAHLHPRWQRIIVPALMDVVSQLESSLSPQLHIATHSPMVMASVETRFDTQKDALHHLKLVGQEVIFEKLPFVKRGRVDLWLMSDVFGLKQPRSLPAESAINDAKALQLSDTPSTDKVNEVNNRLIKYLAPDDDFWPRWRFFAEKHGVDE